MKNQTDPVVQDLNSWINRSAGQHQRRLSEGTASARRVLDETPECGHGTCAARVDCTGECALRAAVLNLPVIDEKFLDEQIKPMPIEMFDIPDVIRWGGYLKAAAMVVAFGLALGCVLYVSTF